MIGLLVLVMGSPPAPHPTCIVSHTIDMHGSLNISRSNDLFEEGIKQSTTLGLMTKQY